MPAKHSVKAKMAKAKPPRAVATTVFIDSWTLPVSGYLGEGYEYGQNVAVIPFSSRKQARAAVKVHNMTPIQRQTWFKQKMFDQFGWLFNDEEARAVLSALHFREGTKE